MSAGSGLRKRKAEANQSPRKQLVLFQQVMAGPVRFELTMGFPTPVFKTGAFNRSATDPFAAGMIAQRSAGHRI